MIIYTFLKIFFFDKVYSYSLVIVLIPIINTLAIYFTGKWTKINNSLIIISSIIFFLYVVMHVVYCASTYNWDHQIILIELGNNLHISLKPGLIGLVFSLLVSFLWMLTSIYTVHYMEVNYTKNNYSKLLCLLSMSIGCTIFIAFSGDLLTTFIFYELLTISTYPLITYNGTNASIVAGRYYLGALFFSSLVLFFPAIGLLYNEYHTLDFVKDGIVIFDESRTIFTFICFIMLVYGIGKTALIPMHFWLPRAMVAPTPVSAILHAVAVVKSGVFILIKIIVYIFGIANLQHFMNYNWIIVGWLPYVAGSTIIISSLIALKQKELKKLLAYSTISQLSYIILFVSIFTTAGIKAAVFQLICHAFAKITLFFVAGAIITKTGEKYLDKMHGIGRSMPITMITFTIGALSMIGVPPTPTFWSKILVLQSVFRDENMILFIFIALVLLISTLLNALYFLPIIYNAFFSKASQNFSIKRIPALLILPPVITSICTLILFLYGYQFIIF